MPCLKPLKGYRARAKNDSGKYSIVFNTREGYHDMPVDLPCSQCRWCKLDRSRQWATRCVHESQLHEQNSFITLTYDEEHLPLHGSLEKKALSDFMKRLWIHEQRAAEKEGRKKRPTRYYACGEYGELNARPHYHACIFGYDFDDKKRYAEREGNTIWTSETLNKLWPYGKTEIGSLTWESAAYVARYIMKKINGPLAEKYYEEEDEETGQLKKLQPEFTIMSRNPGLGTGWYQKYKKEVFPDNFIIMNGVKMKPPKTYKNLLEKENALEYKILQQKLKKQGEKHKDDNTWERLKTKEKILKKRTERLLRNYEKE